MNCFLCVQEHYDYFSFSGANLMTLIKETGCSQAALILEIWMDSKPPNQEARVKKRFKVTSRNQWTVALITLHYFVFIWFVAYRPLDGTTDVFPNKP